MKRYLIKEISTGTENNPSFAGVKNTYYLGKGHSTNVGRMVIENDVSSDRLDFAIQYLAREYGYESERACKIGIAAEKKRSDEETAQWRHHTFELEVFEVEVFNNDSKRIIK